MILLRQKGQTGVWSMCLESISTLVICVKAESSVKQSATDGQTWDDILYATEEVH